MLYLNTYIHTYMNVILFKLILIDCNNWINGIIISITNSHYFVSNVLIILSVDYGTRFHFILPFIIAIIIID